jgi:hypothetical protein
MSESNPQEQKPEEPKVYNEETAILKEKLLIALVATDKGPGILANIHDRETLIMAKGEIEAFLTLKLMQGDARAEQMRRGKIVPAKGGIMNFARRFK